MRTRIAAAALAAASLGAAGLASAPVAAADNISGCQLNGNANFDNPLTGAGTTNTTYSFTGTVSGCNSSESGAPTSGKIEAGVDYLPKPTLSGGCGQSTTKGISVVTWASGTQTVIEYKTTGAAAAVALTGTVIDKVDRMVPVKQADGSTALVDQPFFTTEKSTPSGNKVAGPLAFQPPDPTACGPTGSGVSKAGITGAVLVGDESEVPLPWPPPAAAHRAQHHVRAHAHTRTAGRR